jgi:hypothetical protein
MNPSQHVSTLRQTHRAATTILPVLTATLTVAGAVIAAMEARAPHTHAATRDAEATGETTTADELTDATQAHGAAPRVAAGKSAPGAVTVRSYIATLVGRMLLVALGMALVLSLVYVASATGQVGRAILLTALILLALYLTEKVARRA